MVSMSLSLPYSNFRFLNNNEIEELNVLSIDDNAENGYILEVNLLYPEHLHHYHNDLPFCPEKFIPPGDYQLDIIPDTIVTTSREGDHSSLIISEEVIDTSMIQKSEELLENQTRVISPEEVSTEIVPDVTTQVVTDGLDGSDNEQNYI
ncbi:unnamed protein product [Diatraea saccharalis]|uniref:Uncharacterized protein n=1 Tax=Diatraea saccharalis TaxID=40085 RepID=A0A9N9WFY7_9NEOP|nr:unnamed protein product [Diatraea saccharalis]